MLQRLSPSKKCEIQSLSPRKRQKKENTADFITSSPKTKTPDSTSKTKGNLNYSFKQAEDDAKTKKSLIDLLFSPMFKLLSGKKRDAKKLVQEKKTVMLQSSETLEETIEDSESEISISFAEELVTTRTQLSQEDDEESSSEEFDPWLFIRTLPSDPPPHGPPVLPAKSEDDIRPTLVLDLDETLVHCRLDKSENPDIVITVPFAGVEYEVAVYKRPHFAEFLKSVAQHFEVVVFTASQRVYADKLLDILDPDKFIKHRLFRDSCVLVHGNYLKDLNILGRNLAQTVIIDNSPHVFGFQLDNGIPIETWFANNDQDSELLKLVPFLESLVNVEDVRPLVREQFQLYKKVVN